MKVTMSCPLGSDCEKSTDDGITRCAWYVRILGKNPQTNADVDEWQCAIALMPLLQIETAGTNRGQTAALESFRNEVVGANAVNALNDNTVELKQIGAH